MTGAITRRELLRLADEPSLQRLQEELNGLFGSGQATGGGSQGTTVERL